MTEDFLTITDLLMTNGVLVWLINGERNTECQRKLKKDGTEKGNLLKGFINRVLKVHEYGKRKDDSAVIKTLTSYHF